MSKYFDYFDKVCVLSLPHRSDRLDEFYAKLPLDWPFRRPTLVRGVYGRSLSMPKWWNSGPGAWGCYRSHLRIIEDALCEGCNSVLILEDDARCVPDFSTKVSAFYRNLPDHLGLQYLGGEFLRYYVDLPVKINDYCYRPFNVNRTHALGIRGREHLEFVYRYLADLRDWTGRHHIDHYLAILHEKKAIPVVCPRDWLCVQAATTSDITGATLAETKFRGAEKLLRNRIDRTAVAVVGSYRSGSSLVAGMLHKAGIHMGPALKKPNASNPHGFFESESLAGICRRAFKEPWLKRQTPADRAIDFLSLWAGDHCEKLDRRCPAFGGKHPLMGLLTAELIAAWNNPYFVCTERPVHEIVKSLSQSNWSWPAAAIEQTIPRMIEYRDQQLDQLSDRVIRIPFLRAKEDPVGVISELAEFIGVPLAYDTITAAAAHARL